MLLPRGLALLTALGLLATPLARAETELLGVVEQGQCGTGPEAKELRARVMFSKAPSGWEAVNSDITKPLPAMERRPWLLVADGRSLGAIFLGDPSPDAPRTPRHLYNRAKRYLPLGPALPTRPNIAGEFSGWCGSPQFQPTPIVTTAAPPSDPARWRPYKAGASYQKKLLGPLRQALGSSSFGRCNGESVRAIETPVVGADLKIKKAFNAANGNVLVSIGFDPTRLACKQPYDVSVASHWFLVRKDGIDFIGRQMELIAAADFDGDGQTEMLFWSSAENADGYVLYVDGLRQRIEYIWNYI